MWDRQIPELARQWRVVRYDLPGHGGAPAHSCTSVSVLADRLLATLGALGIDGFGYGGCGIGAAVGAELALRQAGADGGPSVTALALVSASARFGTADEYRQRGVVVRANGLDPMARSVPERWFTADFATAQQTIVEWAVHMVRTTDPGCYIAACEALAAFDVRAELPRIGVPTLVLVGSEDRVTTPADARGLVAGIPDARLALVPGTSHMVPVEQPAAVTDLLVRHFTASRQDTGSALTAPRPAPAAGAAQSGPRAAGAGPALAARPIAEIGSGAAPPEVRAAHLDSYEAGMKVRREVLGDAHVDRCEAEADDFTRDFTDFATRYAWGEVWTRPGIDRRTRSIVTLTALAARGHYEELASHTRAALRNGLTPAEIREVLLHTAVYCGVPAAGSAFRVAQEVIREETTPR
jgi:3-oxoadipate enol-lactonase/4-carboxymuconolactone decarboxylase